MRLLLFLLVILFPFSAFAASGGIYPNYPYAWSNTIGWINFYGTGNVQVSDTDIEGYAWSQNLGWINLHPSNTTYVHNDGTGNLSGYAWGMSIGFIDFSGVTIDSDGFFHGYASSSIAGIISFNCDNTQNCANGSFKVRTYWHPSTAITPTPPIPATTSGGGGGSGPLPVANIVTSSSSSSTILSVATSGSTTKMTVSAISNNPTTQVPFLATIFATPSLRCPVFTKALKRGDTNTQVILIQTFLMYEGYMATSTPTNYFGAKTEVGVKAFQTAYASSILTPWGFSSPTGWWYITTRKKANEIVGCIVTGSLEVTAPSGSKLNIRATPSTNASILTQVDSGSIFRYYDQNNSWYYVDYKNGSSGWVYGSYVTILSKSVLQE